MLNAVHLDDLEAEMIVGRDVIDGKGTKLVPSGTKLTASMIETFRKRDVDEVIILIPEEDDEATREILQGESLERDTDKVTLSSKATAKLNEALVRLDGLFLGMHSHVVMGPLYTAAVKYWTAKASELDTEEGKE